MRFPHIVLPAVLLVASASAGASTIGLEGSPTLDIFWQSSTAGSTPIQVGSLAFSVDDQGNFALAQSETFSSNGDSISIYQAEGNLDPFMNFGLAVTDSGAPSIFSFLFSSPIAPTISGWANYYLSLAGSFSNGGAPNPNNGGSIAIAAPNAAGVMDALLNTTTPNGGIGGAAVFPASPPGSSTYGAFATSGGVNCALLGGCTSFQSRIAFLLSGGGDVMTLSGTYEIVPEVVPVPAAVWLMGSALGLLACVKRRSAA